MMINLRRLVDIRRLAELCSPLSGSYRQQTAMVVTNLQWAGAGAWRRNSRRTDRPQPAPSTQQIASSCSQSPQLHHSAPAQSSIPWSYGLYTARLPLHETLPAGVDVGR